MKMYINGRLSVPMTDFHLSDVWFTNDDLFIHASCDGFDCETSVSEDGLSFSTRWKSVSFEETADDGLSDTEGVPMTQERFMEWFHNSFLHIANVGGFVDDNVEVYIDKCEIITLDEHIVAFPATVRFE